MSFLLKLLLPTIIKAVNKAYSLSYVRDYVFNENALDKKVSNLEVLMVKVLENSHPPVFHNRDYEKIIERLDKLEGKEPCKTKCKGSCIQHG